MLVKKFDMKFAFLLTIAHYIKLSRGSYTPDSQGHVIIPSGTTTIQTNDITTKANLKSIDFNQDGALVTIKTDAFKGSSLVSVNFPLSLEKIEDSAFEDSSKLNSIVLNEGLTEIGIGAFMKTSLYSIDFPSTLKKIPKEAFADVKTLDSITFSEGLEEIGISAFTMYTYGTNLNLTTIKFPNSLIKLDSSSFRQRINLETITFNEGLEEIQSSAFYKCYSLKNFKLPSTLKLIGSVAFFETSIENLTIPSSVTMIESAALHSSTKLTNVIIEGDKTEFTNDAFFNCPLKIVTIPSSLKSFGGSSTFSNFPGFKCDLTSTCNCNLGYDCELSQSGSYITASLCKPGTYKDVEDKNPCKECPAGKFMQSNIIGSESSSDCITCPIGTFTSLNGSFFCLPNEVLTSPSSPSSPSVQKEDDDDEVATTQKIAISAVVIGSFSFIINVLNFFYNMHNNIPRNNVNSKIPTTDEKEIEVI